MLSLSVVVTIATAVRVGNGAAAPKWSGTQRMSKPASSARLALSSSASRDLKNRMLIPKRKSLATNNLRSTIRYRPTAGGLGQSLNQGAGDRRQDIVTRHWAARADPADSC